jgi:hypothetical protein
VIAHFVDIIMMINKNIKFLWQNEADFLISYATVPGYASFRCPINGNWYISSLFANLTKYAQS